jgi:hypothetical protein
VIAKVGAAARNSQSAAPKAARPLLQAALARPDRKAVLEGSDGPLLVIRTAAGEAISVGYAEMRACPRHRNGNHSLKKPS